MSHRHRRNFGALRGCVAQNWPIISVISASVVPAGTVNSLVRGASPAVAGKDKVARKRAMVLVSTQARTSLRGVLDATRCGAFSWKRMDVARVPSINDVQLQYDVANGCGCDTR